MPHPPNAQKSQSTVNAIAALASFIVPGLGQLIQNRVFSAITYFAIEVMIWFMITDACLMMLGVIEGWGSPWCLVLPLISHVASAHDSATYKND